MELMLFERTHNNYYSTRHVWYELLNSIENIEKMEKDMKEVIDGSGKESIHCFRGVGDQLVFDDDEGLKLFTSLCHYPKENCQLHYSAVKNGIYNYLVHHWGIQENLVEVALITIL